MKEERETNKHEEGVVKQLKSFMVIAIVTCFWAICAIPAQAEIVYNTKLLLHGTKQVSETSKFGISGWLIIPNPGAKVTVAVAGPKYCGNNWWIEFNAGAFIKENKGEGMIDIRFSYDKKDPVHIWSNIEYFMDSQNWYTYLDANYRLGQICLLGAETENMHFKDAVDDYGYGPRLVLPFKDGQFVLIGSYQFHSGPNQIWARAVLNF
ncbi:hypothetical protein KKC06_02135 [Patescibacteria group bacterium]|nr:hypothetical protein [Patescibacteria group bacterium]